MNRYFSTTVSGLEEAAMVGAKLEIPDIRVELVGDGLVIYQTTADGNVIGRLRCFNNSFRLLFSLKAKNSAEAMEQLLRETERRGKIRLPAEKRTGFRIMLFKENQPWGLGEERRNALEKVFVCENCFINRNRPQTEVVFMARRDGLGLVGMKLTNTRLTEKGLHPGELKPEPANLLCVLSEPASTDVFLDPFAGYGAIPVGRAAGFAYRRIYAGDKEVKMIRGLTNRMRRFGKRVIVGQWDATRLTEFENESIDKIVTDPPWGIYTGGNDVHILYSYFIKEADRVLKPKGVLVVLTAATGALEVGLTEQSGLRLEKIYRILVSGKKAGVYKIRKAG